MSYTSCATPAAAPVQLSQSQCLSAAKAIGCPPDAQLSWEGLNSIQEEASTAGKKGRQNELRREERLALPGIHGQTWALRHSLYLVLF